jgi:hypothetical protein
MDSLSQPTVQTSSSLSALKAFSIAVVNPGDDLVTIFMQKTKTLFDKLAAASRPVSLEDFNLYLFRGLRGEFKDLVRTLVTKAEPLLYPELHSHFLTHEFLHKTSFHSMSVVATALLLPMSTHPPSAHGAQRQPSSSYNSNYNFSCGKGRSRGGWRNNYNSNYNTNVWSDFRGFYSSSSNNWRQGNW